MIQQLNPTRLEDMAAATETTTLVAEILALVEKATVETEGVGISIANLVGTTEKSETTVRKTVKELADSGLIAQPAGSTSWVSTKKRKRKSKPGKVNMTKSPAGRKPIPEVAERHEAVYKYIAASDAGRTVAEVAETHNIPLGIAYLTIYNLRNKKRVKKTRNGTRTPLWVAS